MWLTWRDATERALYGADGFYRAADQPARHFRTSVHASASYAAALSTLLRQVDTVIGHPSQLDLVDVGAGGGELAGQMLALVPSDLRMRLNVTAVGPVMATASPSQARGADSPAASFFRCPLADFTGLADSTR